MRVAQLISPEQARRSFEARHAVFARDVYPGLVAALNAATGREADRDPIIHFLGIRIARDWEAILTLVSFDMAHAAQSLLRGMFERAVNMAHLHLHPEDMDRFGEFDYVQRRKLWRVILDLTGSDPTDDRSCLDTLETNYQRVKERFQQKCPGESCDEIRQMPSWSKLDTVAMAKRIPALRPFILEAYYRPLLQAHSTVQSMIAGLDQIDGEMKFATQYFALSDHVLQIAHGLLLAVLNVNEAHYPDPIVRSLIDSAIEKFDALYPE